MSQKNSWSSPSNSFDLSRQPSLDFAKNGFFIKPVKHIALGTIQGSLELYTMLQDPSVSVSICKDTRMDLTLAGVTKDFKGDDTDASVGVTAGEINGSPYGGVSAKVESNCAII